jgi:hypothetical protein
VKTIASTAFDSKSTLRPLNPILFKCANQDAPGDDVGLASHKRINGNIPYDEHSLSFVASLPIGFYNAVVLDPSGQQPWPSSVKQSNEEAMFATTLNVNSVVPALRRGKCNE